MSASVPFIGPVAAPWLHVMTLNVRRPTLWPTRAEQRWSTRRPLLRRVLEAERPSILGLQEVMPAQSDDIDRMLGRRYAMVGSGRGANHDGERCEIRFDIIRLRLIGSRTWWLSDRPDVPGSRSYGNVLPRIAVQAELEDNELGTRFHVIVTHLDHLSARSRLASARQIRRVASALDVPHIVMGDFNAGPSSGVASELCADRLLADTWLTASQRLSPAWDTYSNYGPPRQGGRRVDWVLVSTTARVEAAGVNPVRFGSVAVSDHEPVHALIRWEANP
ncbi:endonuclease/exonuclease/phosphatase family protein [Leifsonia sp. A12D58]|uniref:endonuclease/exonuclease/phosphatase family protein n=1 Tax=Leifsonia sp. A12D58 TaxID=3397674 RepID=UPI0039E0B8D0